jgi:hypothetical protein
MSKYNSLTILTCAAIGLGLSACGGLGEREAKYPTGASRSANTDSIYEKPQSILGEGGLKLLGGDKGPTDGVITVNSFLWRAALDTLSFMPISSVDPFGGVILTDWYSAPETPNERYKLNVFVLGSQLRSDAIKVSVFKENRASSNASWKTVSIKNEMARKIEDTILTRARELRVAKINNTSE